MLTTLALLTTALLFGGMTLYAIGFAPVLFTTLPPASARRVLRGAFPWFYGFVVVTALLAAALWWPQRPEAAAVLAAVGLSTVPVRQALMPAINDATDAGQRRRFQVLHGLSVLVTLAHIAASGWVLAAHA